MPNIKSAKKRVLVNETKAMQNKAAKSALKTDIKKFEAALAEGNRSEAEGAYKVAVKAVDKAVVHGLLHRNNAAGGFLLPKRDRPVSPLALSSILWYI